MALMLGALYDALISAHVTDDLARKAAEEVAAYDARFAAIERELAVLKWMVGTNVVLTLGVLWRVLVR
jgi:hypothetical protein